MQHACPVDWSSRPGAITALGCSISISIRVSTALALKGAILTANGDTGKAHVISVTENIQLDGPWLPTSTNSAMIIGPGVQVAIKGTKPGADLTQIKGQGTDGRYAIFQIQANAQVVMENLDLRDGYTGHHVSSLLPNTSVYSCNKKAK